MEDYKCKICEAPVEADGVVRHSRSCYVYQEDGGGEEWVGNDKPLLGVVLDGEFHIYRDRVENLSDSKLSIFELACARIAELEEQLKRCEGCTKSQ